ncbi:MAG: prepilin peptidase [Candidatus Woesearchaeota archaeon]
MLTITLIFITGLILGSFFNVVIYRLPRGESIITPPSHCPECNTRLKTIDLIPVISYIINKGKCRYCGANISWQYPVVELITAFLYLFTYLKFGLTIEFLIYLFLISYLIIISFIDYNEKIIPNFLSYSGIIIGLVLAIIFNHITFISSLIGLIVPSFLLLIIALIFKGGMGIGDVKLVGMIGAFTGYLYPLLAIFLGALIGSVLYLPLMIRGKVDGKTRIPFGPLINIGALIMIFFGERLIDLYWIVFL